MGGPYIDDEEDLDEQRRREEEDSAPPVTAVAPVPPPPDVPPVASAPVGGQPAMVGAPPPMIPLAPVSHPDAPPVQPAHQLSPARQRLQELITQGAPPVKPLHGVKKFFDVLGQAFAPGIEQSLRYAPQREYRSNLGRAEADVEADKSLHPEAAPKADKWAAVTGFEGPNGEPLERDEATGHYRIADLPTGVHPIAQPKTGTPQERVMDDLLKGDNGKPRINPATQKPYTTKEAYDESQKPAQGNETEKAISDTVEAHGWPNDAQHRNMARDENAKRNPTAHVSVEGQGGSWMPLYDKEGHVTGAWNPKTGEQKTATNLPGTTSVGMGAERKDDQQTKADAKAVNDLDSTLGLMKTAAAKPSGANDFAIIMSFVGAVKPENVGKIRWQKAEQDYVEGLRNSIGDAAAWEKRIETGERLTPDERNDMIKAVQIVRDAKAKTPGGGGESPGQPKVGDSKTFPNGKTATWDGKGWAAH